MLHKCHLTSCHLALCRFCHCCVHVFSRCCPGCRLALPGIAHFAYLPQDIVVHLQHVVHGNTDDARRLPLHHRLYPSPCRQRTSGPTNETGRKSCKFRSFYTVSSRFSKCHAKRLLSLHGPSSFFSPPQRGVSPYFSRHLVPWCMYRPRVGRGVSTPIRLNHRSPWVRVDGVASCFTLSIAEG
jgi:hypothetical protein